MSNNEKQFEQMLIDNNVEYEYQPIIDNVKFTKSGKYKADFKVYNRDKSEYVIVEVKGFMTYEAVNKLKYLTEVHSENICIFQMTEKDWLQMPTKDSIRIQFNILMTFVENGDAEKINNNSIIMLSKYINYKNMEYIKYSSPYFDYNTIFSEDLEARIIEYISSKLKYVDLDWIAYHYKDETIPPGILTDEEYPVDKTSIEIILKTMIYELIFSAESDTTEKYIELPDKALDGLYIARDENTILIYYGYIYEYGFSISPDDVLIEE